MVKIFSLESLRAPVGRVIIEIESMFNDKIKLGEHELELDVSFDPEMHTVGKGILHSVCDKLPPINSPDAFWGTTIEAKKGDIVYFTWMATDLAIKRGEVMSIRDSEANKYRFFISASYYDLTLIVANEKITMLNGYCLLSTLKDTEVSELLKHPLTGLLENPEMVKNKVSTSWGKIVACGSPNVYREAVYSDNCDVAPGDIVLFKKNTDVPLQYDIHSDLIGKEKLLKIQRRYMIAKV